MSLEDIKARSEAATPGPWKALGTGVAGGDHWYVCDDGQSLASIASNDGENEDQRQPDAEFIAHARTDIPKLVAALEAVLDYVDVAGAYPIHRSDIEDVITDILGD